MNQTPAVIALDERANIYKVLDEFGRTIGTGTREVCEFLAQLIMKPAMTANEGFPQRAQSRNNLRSAIKL